ncbi:fibronectin type III domain-containing protein [Microbacterium sp. CIAB417]|uniref:fibronectin type III domain-containing protein n=1 Tax=Microbacterium sp. CIAB417 TaxID=2860287 RepID=UPI001FAD992C|nr:fibronectin type III domain-containing protein [Microbacterium sp. CIAB417]
MASRHGARSRLFTSFAAFAATIALVVTGATGAVAVADDTVPEPTPTVTSTPVETVAPEPAPEEPAAPEAPAPSTPVEAPIAPAEPEAPDAAPTAPENGSVARSGAPEELVGAAAVQAASFTYETEDPRSIDGTEGTPGVVTLTGRVVDAGSGAPAAQVPVWAEFAGDGVIPDDAVYTTADGRFTLTLLTDQWYGVNVGPAYETKYLRGFGSLEDLTLGYAYDLGDLGVAKGALLTGVLTAPAAATGPFWHHVAAVSDDVSSGWNGIVTPGVQTTWQTVVPAGTYRVKLSDGSSFREAWWNGAATEASATPITVTVGETVAGLDAVLSYGDTRISGVVRDTAGRPLEGATVAASAQNGSWSYSRAKTDSQGRYVLGNLIAAPYRIDVSPKQGDGLHTYYGGETYDTATLLQVVAGASLTGIDVTVERGGAVTGTLPGGGTGITSLYLVEASNTNISAAWATRDGAAFTFFDVPPGTYRFAYSAGDVRTVWGDPFTVTAGETVTLDLAGMPAATTTKLTVTIDMATEGYPTVALIDPATSGEIATRWLSPSTTQAVFDVPAGDYIVRYSDSSTGTTVYYDGANSLAAATVVTVADEPVSILISGGTGTISGEITDAADGEPVEGVTLQLYRADNTNTSSPIASTVTDRDGRYAFNRLGVNNFALKAVGGATLYIDRWFGGDGTQQDASAISLDADETYDTADIAMTLGGGVSGTFPEASSFETTAWVSLSLSPTDGDYRAYRSVYTSLSSFLDDEGTWSVFGLAPGDYSVNGSIGSAQVRAAGTITVTAGAVTDGIVLEVVPPQISGTVRAADGTPIYAQVRAEWTEGNEDSSWSNSRSTYSDSSTGAYQLSGIPDGATVYLHFQPWYASTNATERWWRDAATREDAETIVVGGAPVTADMTLPAGVIVTGRLVDSVDRSPVRDASVHLEDRSSVSTSATGAFTFYVPAAGEYALSIGASSTHVATETTITVPADGLTGLEIALERGYRITGTVSAANNGAALSGVSVYAYDADDRWSNTNWSYSSNSDGGFATQALRPGRYKVEFSNWSGLYVTQWYDGADEFDDAQVIEIVDRDITNLDVRMSLGGTVSGRILGPDGAPLSAATVGVATAPETNVFARMFGAFAAFVTGAAPTSPILDIEVTTDENGDFQLPPLPPGDYTLYVYHPELGTVWYDDKPTRETADIIHISGGARVQLPEVEVPELPEGATPLTPEQSLSETFQLVAGPQSATVTEGAEVSFEAIASGIPVPTVQWERRDAGSDTWTPIEGAQSPTLWLDAAGLDDDGAQFRAVFTQGTDTIETDAATLTVTAAPTAPKAPAAPTVSDPTTTEATVTWTAPANGGSPITGYEIVLYEAGEDNPLRTIPVGAVTTQKIGGLEPGTGYEVTVAARNVLGTGAASARTPFGTKALTVPGAPTDVKVTATTPDSLALSWTAPTDDGNSPITGFRVTVKPAGGDPFSKIAAANATGIVIDELDADTLYELTVRAVNAVGEGAPTIISGRTDVQPPVITVPSAPAGLRTTSVTSTTATIVWNAPEDDGGSPVTSYLVTVTVGDRPADAAVVVDGRTALIADLDPSTAYAVTVKAVNEAGTSAASEPLPFTTEAPPVTVPGTPTGVDAAAISDSEITVAWTAPEDDGGAPVSYQVDVRKGGDLVRSVTATETTATVDGLDASTEYAVTVTARNKAGAGAASVPVTVTTNDAAPVATVPGVPGPVSAAGYPLVPGAVNLVWTAPLSDGGSPITSYVVRAYPAEGSPLSYTTTGTMATMGGLEPGKAYTFTVAAVNAVGSSEESVGVSIPLPGVDAGGQEPGSGEEPGSGSGDGSGAGQGPVVLAPTGGAPVAPSESGLNDANRGDLGLDLSRVPAGGTLTLSGLVPGQQYDVWFFSTPTYAGSHTADAQGKIVVKVPASLAAGTHTVVVTSSGTVVAWRTLTVTGLPATGADAPIGLAVGGGMLLLFGLACVIAARRRLV